MRLEARTVHADDVAAPGPIVKWAGGKTKLLPELLKRVPLLGGCGYFEPFAGGAALFFRLSACSLGQPGQSFLSDVNPDLMATYRAVTVNVEAVVRELLVHAANHAEDTDYYYRVRESFNAPSPSLPYDGGVCLRANPIERAATFIYLNKTCFNGLWRVNASGKFNVPRGDYANPTVCRPAELRAASLALRQAELACVGYQDSVKHADEGDFVYFDPPYDGTYSAYSVGGFGMADQVALADSFHDLARRGVRVMLSNADTPFVRNLYSGCRIDVVKCGRSINSDGSGRGKVGEVIVTAGYSC